MVSGAEEARIGRALESVRPWVREIVVVLNDDVTDGTERILKDYRATVHRERWRGFVAQKGSVSDKAGQPWLLNLDADEVVPPALRDEIQAVIRDEGRGFSAFEFPRCTFYCGRWIRHGDWYPDRVLRLWKKGSARWGGEEPHARLEVTGRVGRLRSDLLHYSNESIQRQIAKIAPYHAGFVARRMAAGKSAGVFELVVRPGWRFVRAYLVRRGFQDGWPGLYIAALSAFSTLTRNAMVLEAQDLKRLTKK